MDSQNLEKGQLPSYQDLQVDAKEKIASTTPEAFEEGRQSSAPTTPTNKMAFYRRTMLFLGFTWLILYGVAMAGENRLRWQKGCNKAQVSEQQSGAQTDESSSFSSLLNGASAKSLHDLLHRHLPKQFQDGVWESEHHAIRAVHQNDPALATSILQLAKRQENNSTAASTTESSTTTPSTSSSSPNSTPSPTRTPTPTNSPPVTTSKSSTPPPSTTQTSSTPPETTLTTSTIPDREETSTTIPPTRTSRSIVTTFTRTSNGNVVTITSTTFVLADPVETAPVETTTRATPGLQNSAPQQQRGSLLAGVIALMAVLMA